MKKIFLNSLIIIALLISVFILPLYRPTGIAVYFRLFLLILILVESLKLFKIVFIDKKIKKFISNSATVLFSIFVLEVMVQVELVVHYRRAPL